MGDTDFLAMFNEIARKVEKGKEFPLLTRDAKISSLGIDSVAMMEIIGVIEDEFDVVIPDEKLSQLQTISDIEKVVLERRAGRA